MIIPYRFRSIIDADLPMLERWLKTSEVVRWWGDPAEQLALLTEDLDDPLMRQWIVEYGQHPFAHTKHMPGRRFIFRAFQAALRSLTHSSENRRCLDAATEAHSWVCWPAASFEKVPL